MIKAISNILGFNKQKHLTDANFGMLTYVQTHGDQSSYWETMRFFKPASHEIELLIETPDHKTAPSAQQAAFFENTEKDFGNTLLIIEKTLRPGFEEWTGKPMMLSFDQEFTVAGISIPWDATSESAVWHVIFSSASDNAHTFTAFMKGHEVQHISIDG